MGRIKTFKQRAFISPNFNALLKLESGVGLSAGEGVGLKLATENNETKEIQMTSTYPQKSYQLKVSLLNSRLGLRQATNKPNSNISKSKSLTLTLSNELF